MLLSYSLSYSAPAVRQPGAGYMPYELVGVGRFELPASSSRTKRAAKLRYTPPARDLTGSARTSVSLAETRPCSCTAAADVQARARGNLTGVAWHQGEQASLRAAGEAGRGPR